MSENLRKQRCKGCYHYQSGSCHGLADGGACGGWEPGLDRSMVASGLVFLAALVGMALVLAIRLIGGW